MPHQEAAEAARVAQRREHLREMRRVESAPDFAPKKSAVVEVASKHMMEKDHGALVMSLHASVLPHVSKRSNVQPCPPWARPPEQQAATAQFQAPAAPPARGSSQSALSASPYGDWHPSPSGGVADMEASVITASESAVASYLQGSQLAPNSSSQLGGSHSQVGSWPGLGSQLGSQVPRSRLGSQLGSSHVVGSPGAGASRSLKAAASASVLSISTAPSSQQHLFEKQPSSQSRALLLPRREQPREHCGSTPAASRC